MGLFSKLLRRFGYVRLREYNLRLTVDGRLTPINSAWPIPLDYGRPAAAPPSQSALWPRIPQSRAQSLLPQPAVDLAEGTADGLEPVTPSTRVSDGIPLLGDTDPMMPTLEPELGDTKPLRVTGGRRRDLSDTIPQPFEPPDLAEDS